MTTHSRSTYRKPASEVAWQRQLRDSYEHEGVPDVDLSLKSARVARVGASMAASIILRYEWLGTMGNASLHYGVMFGGRCAGVCCVAVRGSGTAGTTVGAKFGLGANDISTLVRGACAHWAPAGSNSKLVSWTCRFARKDSGAKVILAYSDSEAGEIGTIYQACGWTYIGKTHRPDEAEFVSPKGRVLNSRTISHWAKKYGIRYREYRDALLSRGWHPQPGNPKGIYVQVLDRSDKLIVTRVARMSKPYPKRAGSIGSDATTHQVVEGGAVPTPALHSQGTA